jgi:hypothetical protein
LNSPRLLVFLSIPVIFLVFAACGKKAPPFLSERVFSTGVSHLTGEWNKGEILLKGSILPSPESGEPANLVKGARVYYAQYSPEEAPCAECPVTFHEYEIFDQEVIVKGDFLCPMPANERGHVYFYRVHLIGAEGAVGPPSNTVRIAVE